MPEFVMDRNFENDFSTAFTMISEVVEAAYNKLLWTNDQEVKNADNINPRVILALTVSVADFLQQEGVMRILDRHSLTPESVGHNFILSAGNHGAGFWDLGLGRDGQELHDACKYMNVELYQGKDLSVYPV